MNSIDGDRCADLLQVLPEACFEDRRFCAQPGYDEWERTVAGPALAKNGWTVISWHNGEADSFGPLTRYALCILRGRRWRLVYG